MQPHPALRPYVETLVPYQDRMAVDGVHLGLPSASCTVIVAFDQPLDVGWLSAPERHEAHWMSVSGLHTAPALIHTHGYQHGIQVQLTPLGVRALFGLPIGAVAAEVVPMSEVPRGFDPATYDRIGDGSDDVERAHRVQGVLLDRLASTSGKDRIPADLARAWSRLAASQGTARITDLAAELGWSRRHLVTRFTAEFGLAPKRAARLFRFQHARSLVTRGVPLADTAARSGFADQAHLTREWRSLAGQSPTRTLSAPYTNLQDVLAG